MDFSEGVVGYFQVSQEVRNYPRHFAPMMKHGVGYVSHQAVATTPINKPDVAGGHFLAEFNGHFVINRIDAETRRAVNDNALSCHEFVEFYTSYFNRPANPNHRQTWTLKWFSTLPTVGILRTGY
jgi:hypothetical protein